MKTLFAAAISSLAIASPAAAVITAYSQNFDGLTPSGTVLSDDGWEYFADNAGLGAYGGAAPGAGPQISALANDGSGNQYINFYANYGNGPVHNNPPLQEAISLYVNQPFTAGDADLGETWYFDFSFALNQFAAPGGSTQVGAFIRVFDPFFNLLDEQTFDTSVATAAFQPAPGLSQTFDPGWDAGGFVQFGFNNLVGNYEGSGMFYDDIRFANSPIPEPSTLGLLGLSGALILRRRRR